MNSTPERLASRRAFIAAAAASAGSVLPLGPFGQAACAATSAPARETVRISFQRSSTLLTLLKQNGTLEKKLDPLGFDVSWHELGGNALLSALNSGSVDLHADVADAYALFTQAAGAPLTYYAKETAAPTAQAILVGVDSPIKTVADLKGRKVSLMKGAGVHYLLLAALKKAGIKPADLDIRYLEVQDSVTAFNSGSVDAIVVWDPFVAIALGGGKARVLADGRDGLVEYNRFYTATSAFAAAHPPVVKLVFEELQGAGRWVKANPKEAAQRLQPLWGNLSAELIEQVNSRRSYQIVPVQREQLQEQQRIADAFHDAGLIPRELRATDVAIWSPQAA